MRTVFVVPAFDAVSTIAEVVRGLRRRRPDTTIPVLVIDDGSDDETSVAAADAGARVLRHDRNRGKGAALKTGLAEALRCGADAAVSVDADGQHPPDEAARLAADHAPDGALVLGVRNLVAAGAGRANRFGNAVSDFFLSAFSKHRFGDTQCGLRRYPVRATLDLRARDDGYAFEAEILLRAVRAGWTIVEVPVTVHYTPSSRRGSHFRPVRDPLRIIRRVVRTLAMESPGRSGR